jgi:hypothetical protein
MRVKLATTFCNARPAVRIPRASYADDMRELFNTTRAIDVMTRTETPPADSERGRLLANLERNRDRLTRSLAARAPRIPRDMEPRGGAPGRGLPAEGRQGT